MHRRIDIQAASDVHVVRTLWNEYWAELGLPPAFQNFEQELGSLPGAYAPPRGCLIVAVDGSEAAGTIALRPLDELRCEAKRLYVRPPYRRCGIGRELLLDVIEQARKIGYRSMHGDTLPAMTAALTMYEQLGFRRTPPYAEPPTPGAIYLELTL